MDQIKVVRLLEDPILEPSAESFQISIVNVEHVTLHGEARKGRRRAVAPNLQTTIQIVLVQMTFCWKSIFRVFFLASFSVKCAPTSLVKALPLELCGRSRGYFYFYKRFFFPLLKLISPMTQAGFGCQYLKKW